MFIHLWFDVYFSFQPPVELYVGEYPLELSPEKIPRLWTKRSRFRFSRISQVQSQDQLSNSSTIFVIYQLWVGRKM